MASTTWRYDRATRLRWLTWQLAPDCIMGVIEPRRPLEAPKPYVALFTILAFVVLADIAVAAFRHVRKTI